MTIGKIIAIRGGQVPSGTVKVSGAKNSATRLMAAATLTDDEVLLTNAPTEIVDVNVKAELMRAIGGIVQFEHSSNCVRISASGVRCPALESYDFPIRTTYLLVAGQLLRSGRARIPYPGGCKIGNRKYDLHMYVWQCLGCDVIEHPSFIEVIAPKIGIGGAEITFPITTVGGTENALLCGAIARGSTTINNAYITPEVQDLIDMLCAMGAEIEIHGKGCIVLQGKEQLRGVNFAVMPDRIEALTWIVYAALSGGDILVKDVPFETMHIPLLHLQNAGIDFFRNTNSVYVSNQCLDEYGIQPFEVACGTYPGVISDMQPFYVLLALKAKGRSKIIDYRYPERIAFIDHLNRFCGKAVVYDKYGYITVDGPAGLIAAEAESTDLRGSMAVIMAALLAGEGTSKIHNPDMAFRGYNQLSEKLSRLGVDLSAV